MNGAPRVTLLGRQAEELTSFLTSHPHGHERAAVVLFRRLRRRAEGLQDSDRYLAVRAIPFEDAWVTSSSSTHVAFETAPLRDFFRQVDEEGLVFGFIHSHPPGAAGFSSTDTDNELLLLTALKNRNGPKSRLVALVLHDGQWLGRVRAADDAANPVKVRHVAVVGQRLTLHAYAQSTLPELETLARQAAAFGRPFVDQLRSLRVGVVGAGGTGSPTITLLTRAGVRELVIVDPDLLAKSNLNRVRGARMSDVGENKAEIAKRYTESLGLTTSISAHKGLVDSDPKALDAIASCDVVFGCTDDHIGRETILAAAYTYAQVLIDVGLGGMVVDDGADSALLRYHHGRVSTILPEAGECLFCQGVVSQRWIAHQYALRENPNLTEAEARERYLDGGGEVAPGVGPFTSATADYGVATLFDLIRPFRRFPGNLRRDLFNVDFVSMDLHSPQPIHDMECPYCGTRDYVVMREDYRLNRPSLGEPDEAA